MYIPINVYVNAQNSRGVFMWERTCRCISDCPRAERCVRHAQCVAQAPHAYTCRTDRDLCHWLRSVHRRVYRRSVPRVRIKRVPLVWLDISRSFDVLRSAIFHAVDRRHLLDRQHVLFIVLFIYESYEIQHLEKYRNYSIIEILYQLEELVVIWQGLFIFMYESQYQCSSSL